jgi:hypothetical protein
MLRRWFLLPSAVLFLAFAANGESYPAPALPDVTHSGRYLQRTMHLLASSTAEKRNTVKILVYGQSISEQRWWLEVKRDLLERFPHAHLIMENKSIGGFAASLLVKTVEMDVSAFYPDLVLFHVYGDQANYESILRIIRSRTAAEVAIQTDHYNRADDSSDRMANEILPRLAEKYKCELIDIRRPWKRYLDQNNYQPSQLLSDDVHLNEHGCFLMAELIKPYLRHKPEFPRDEFQLMTTYKVGEDVSVENGTLRLPFIGNRIDAIAADRAVSSSSTVLVDGVKPSSFQGTYYMSRPFSDTSNGWPWTLPAMIHVSRDTPWIDEDWTCTFTEAAPPFDDFAFEIRGSKTGADGAGQGSNDFVSNSKRIIIKKGDAGSGGDWHLKRSHAVLKTVVKPGDVVKWKTYSISTDSYSPTTNAENVTTLFQGIPNTSHVLTLQSKSHEIPIHEIRVYKPFLE